MVSSQKVPVPALPSDLPFRIISRTVGQGAYAFIRKACPKDAPKPIIAVKFINKEHAFTVGKVRPKQIQTEVALHDHVGKHQNIIQFLASGEDSIWTWIAMELAEGDLFDKIEADEGVAEDVAHFYFSQLISAIGYVHSRDVAHRDIKPENILLLDGNLKVADFGLAVLYGYQGQKKLCRTVCGSPPYMAPEVVPKGGFTGQKTDPYEANVADIWSCGIVLFVLLVGNTPWDEPTMNSYEFKDYVENGAYDELWQRVPSGAQSLLRGMLRVDPTTRFTLQDVRRHPWFASNNPHMASDGRAANPLRLATQMLENLHIDFSTNPTQSQPRPPLDAMDLDNKDMFRLALTQPETPIIETQFDWERPVRVTAHEGISASQPVAGHHDGHGSILAEKFMDDPALSQFSATPAVPLSVTQQARRFCDIIPEQSLTRFFSFMDFPLLLPKITEAFQQLGIPLQRLSQSALEGLERKVFIPIKTRDTRQCSLIGHVTVERVDTEVLEVWFLKRKGDPLEWRRLFKKIAVLCKDGIIRPE